MEQTQKRSRPAFQPVNLEPIDERLEERAAEKGIPTLVVPAAKARTTPQKSNRLGERSTGRSRMKPIVVDVPDYVWVAVKIRAAQEMASVRHFIMSALRASGIEIKEEDMIEDGRRFR